jgi:hypothetical protein
MTDSPPHSETDLPPPTAPENFQVSLRDFVDETEAREFGNIMGLTIRAISRYINLERLDGITVAYDYDDALAQLDRGYQATRVLTRTANDRMLGVAMAPAVMRGGTVKGHLVFHAPFVLPLQDETSEHYQQALYLVAHECGHIQDLKHRDESFPGTILQQQISDYEEAMLEQVAAALWEEYAACYASALLGDGQAAAYEETFVSALSVATDQANDAITAYRLHGDINRVLEEAGNPICEPLRMAAYLIGHLDGRDEDFASLPDIATALKGSPYEKFVDRLSTILRDLWSRRGHWESREEFVPLHDLTRDVLGHGGLKLERQPDGTLYVDIPYTPETMP